MKEGVTLLNVSRGGLIETGARVPCTEGFRVEGLNPKTYNPLRAPALSKHGNHHGTNATAPRRRASLRAAAGASACGCRTAWPHPYARVHARDE
jgi:hypothetical protein